MNADYKEVSVYYDKLWADLEKQNLTKPNSRHYTILKNLKRAGLKNDSVVLEIGCGIGTLTALVAKNISSGFIVAADISPETIDFDKHKHSSFKNIEFLVSDMTNFSHTKKFDFVVLPDVLEHIPAEAHGNIFKTIRTLIHDKSVVLINIPDPRCLEWFHQYKPDMLQIIDQPLYTDKLLSAIYPHGFYLESLESYALGYYQHDYQSLILRPNIALKEMVQKTKMGQIIAKFKARFL